MSQMLFGKLYNPAAGHRDLSDGALLARILQTSQDARRTRDDHQWSRLGGLMAAAEQRGLIPALRGE